MTHGKDCTCGEGRIDVHAHFLPPCYADALAKAGMTTLDGGFPVPAWSAEAALGMMDRQGIASAVISLLALDAFSARRQERRALPRSE